MDCALKEAVAAQPPDIAPARTAILREAGFDDYGQIAALQARNGLSARSYGDWSALWKRNPAYLERGSPIGWVLERPGGELCGYLGNLPLDYRFGGGTVRGATHHSWVVDPPYRLRSMELLNRYLKQPEIDLFVGTTPNAAAETVLRAFDFTRVPCGEWNRAGFWITGYRGFAAGALRAATFPQPRALAYPLSAGLLFMDALRRPFLGAGPQRSVCEFEVCSRFDARFDRFWEELKAESRDRLLADHSRAALEWHFGRGLERKDIWIIAAARAQRLLAYAIFDRQDHPSLQLKRVRIADFQALRGFQALLSPALRWALDECRRQRLHMLENAGCWIARWGVAGTAPRHRRRLQCWQFYFKTRNPELLLRLQDPNAWAPSAFDGDASL